MQAHNCFERSVFLEQNIKVSRRESVSPSEISSFCAQISMILKSGIPLAEGLEIMREDSGTTFARNILTVIHNELELGMPLHMAVEKTNSFPPYVVNMLEIGEATGKLENVVQSLTSYYEREETIIRAVRSAVVYPFIMVSMMLAVIVVLIVQVLPIFNDVFQGLGAQMTGFPLAVMNLGQALNTYGLIIVSVLFIFILAFFIIRATNRGRSWLEKFKASFFLTKSIHSKIGSGRFASAMSLMLSSGMDTDKSLEMVNRLIKTPSINDKIKLCQQKLQGGVNFSDAISQVGIFTGIYAGMVRVGFKTGSLDIIMEKLANRYEEEAKIQINNVISVIEPTLVAVLSIIVGVILLSVMLPLMGIMAAIG